MSNAKEYLQSIAALDDRINMMEEEKRDLEDRLKHITPTLSFDKASGGGGQHDKMASAIAKIIDLQKMINDLVDNYVDSRKEAIAILNKMTNPTYMTVLHRMYFLNQSLERIASDMNITYRWVCTLHGRALQEFGKLMPQTEKMIEYGHKNS